MKILLIAAIAATLIFTSSQPVEAGLCCKKKEICTQEVCRRCYVKEKRCLCVVTKTTIQEITYETTYEDCKGRITKKTWTKKEKINVERSKA